jgi:hypothetical protein
MFFVSEKIPLLPLEIVPFLETFKNQSKIPILSLPSFFDQPKPKLIPNLLKSPTAAFLFLELVGCVSRQ